MLAIYLTQRCVHSKQYVLQCMLDAIKGLRNMLCQSTELHSKELGMLTVNCSVSTFICWNYALAIKFIISQCSLRVETHSNVGLHKCYRSTTESDGLIYALRISQPSVLSPDSETVGVLSSLPFLLEVVTAFFHAQLQDQPIINLLRGHGTNNWIRSLEPSMGLSSYVAYSYSQVRGPNWRFALCPDFAVVWVFRIEIAKAKRQFVEE
jgi:hypothetical protein